MNESCDRCQKVIKDQQEGRAWDRFDENYEDKDSFWLCIPCHWKQMEETWGKDWRG